MIDVNSKTFSSFTMYKEPNTKIIDTETAYAGLRVCLVLQGGAVWKINQQCYSVGEGDIVLFNDFQKRCIVRYGDSGFTVHVMQLDRRAFVDPSDYLFFCSCIKDINGVLKGTALSQILKEVYNEDLDTKAHKYELMSAKLTEFFIKAKRLLSNSGINVRVDEKMIEILDYIDSRVTENITLKEVAQLAGFTESAFSKRFSGINGVSFKKYVMSKKIERAVYLLKTTDSKVIDIAFACGFNSISGFYDTFKKVTGTTPSKISEII